MTAFVVSQPAALLSRGGRAGLAGVTGRRAPAPRSAVARAPASVTMHGPPAGAQSTEKRPGSHKGFVEEMRFVAMRLHTKDQAPSEGKMEESALPIDAWLPSHAEYLQFLVDSLAMYKYFEEDLPVEETTIFPRFVNTGLERVEALHKDIAYINSLGVETPEPTRAATSYVAYLKNLVAGKPEAVLVHWYNFLFAHSAGGRMIGRLMQNKIFDGRQLEFYRWGEGGEQDVKELLGPVRATIDEVAAGWSRELKDECIKETGLAFGFSGAILQNLAKAPVV